jgi:hypothetical protein
MSRREVQTQEPSQEAWVFADFTLDLKRACLLRRGEEVKLRPKAFETLRYLIAEAALRLAGGRGVFATTRVDNHAMCRTNKRLGFIQSGEPYQTTRSGKTHSLSLFVRRRLVDPSNAPTIPGVKSRIQNNQNCNFCLPRCSAMTHPRQIRLGAKSVRWRPDKAIKDYYCYPDSAQ